MKRYFLILNIFLIAAAVFWAARDVRKIISVRQDNAQPSPHKGEPVPTSAEKNILPLSDYTAICDRNLFNVETKAAEKTIPIKIDSLKQTALALKLWGTVTDNDGKDYAVIESKGGKQNLYRTGDTVQNATVKLILREKVVLLVNGKDEMLDMEKLSHPVRSNPNSNGLQQRPSQRIQLKKSQIENATESVSELMREVNLRPYFENGKPSGLILSRIRPDSIFKKMGLINGDIIKKIDGETISSVKKVLQRYENLKTSGDVVLEIKRRGRIQQIEYHVD
jgi:general secretion pathway protein C